MLLNVPPLLLSDTLTVNALTLTVNALILSDNVTEVPPVTIIS